LERLRDAGVELERLGTRQRERCGNMAALRADTRRKRSGRAALDALDRTVALESKRWSKPSQLIVSTSNGSITVNSTMCVDALRSKPEAKTSSTGVASNAAPVSSTRRPALMRAPRRTPGGEAGGG
jgi:hypothetical protein